MNRGRTSSSEDQSLIGTVGNSNGVNDSDANFFKVISENLKYAFQSPLPNTQFPTPYSHQQQHQDQQHHSNGGENSSSLLENSMMAGLQVGSAHNEMANAHVSGEPLNDKDMQPSSVLQFGNNFPNEFLLTSPEQFREFLFESPGAGFNLVHKTPAKTPLRFFSNSNGGGNAENGDSLTPNGLFGNPSSIKSSKDYNMGKTMQTPLRNIDLNLMFNSNQMAVSSSPSKKLALSLTPYGRKILNGIGTPYAKTLLSSNSALADFQKARKIQSTPPTMKKATETPHAQSHIAASDDLDDEKLNNFVLKMSENIKNNYDFADVNLSSRSKNQDSNKEDLNDQDPDAQDDIYGSSPTTIQLNSSVTKSTTKLGANKMPLLAREIIDSNNEGEMYKVEENRLPLSPTPKYHKSASSLDALNIPELPKMGSFKSERTLSISSSRSTSSKDNRSSGNSIINFKPNKVKKSSKKQPKFQIIVANTQKFSVPTNNQKNTKKFGGLKRSQSLLVNSSSGTANAGRNSSLNNSTNNSTTRNNGNGDFMNTNENFSSKKAKRSSSFSEKDEGQFHGYQ
ncbi:hypothetical protein HG535_0E02150 [Zygotorulaspora mrakii]|uniref:Nuclear division defective protein 1 n=1 Tax=Zygotorulaspora mrakii TaxID=42260 RepID=A0A7H9B396_ZYGMR|nr:uncharacterized protein HG535_0E02150 [Zygotorulaspora mrakii]QLG73131.1 hypothetical protein HG535_0E02150 [Zygotorulaspora mrakii]